MRSSLPTELETIVRLRPTSAGVEAPALQPGRDVVLDCAREQGEDLPFGVLLDDLLPADVREEIDREAIARLATWRQRRDIELTVDGVCLPHIWAVELLAEVFLPETRIVAGLRIAFSQGSLRRVECHGLDAARVAGLRAALAPLGIEVESSGPRVPPPRYPSVLASPWRISLPVRIAASALNVVGVPQRVRGVIYVLLYWHLRPVFSRLTDAPGLTPVLDPAQLVRQRPGAFLRAAARGGWVGKAGALARHRSRRLVGKTLATARTTVERNDPLGSLLDVRALAMLEQRAGETPAVVAQMRKAFVGGKVKLAVLPYDSPPDARAIVQAARDAGVPTLVVQHGLYNEQNEPDMSLADVVAVWSQRDAGEVRRRTSAFIEVTGNPGIRSAELLRGLRQPRPVGRTIVLVEYTSRLSSRIDNRVSLRHVRAALRALAEARPRTGVTIRPHPAEHEPEIFESEASRWTDIEVNVDASSPIGDLIRGADLCIGAVSTATLEAAAIGVPVIFLNVSGQPAPWPLDGSTGVPIATSFEELVDLVPRVLSTGEIPGREDMIQALGLGAEATTRVLDLIGRMVDEPGLGRDTLKLRRAEPEDEARLLAWRNEPATRNASFSPDEIAPDDHHAWFVRKLADPNCALLIVEDDGRPVGQVRLDLVAPGVAEISIGLAPEARGRGIGRSALERASSDAFRVLGVSRIIALVKRENGASLAAFQASGFTIVRDDADVIELSRGVDAESFPE